MCTLIVTRRPDASPQIRVGANRDESFERPAEPPAIRESGTLRVLAPRDERAGGTWLGLNQEGVFAGITNRLAYPLDPDRSSRGELVFRALDHDSARAAARNLGTLDPDSYNPFHLIVVDPSDAYFCVSDGTLRTVSRWSTDTAVVTERSFGAADNPRKRYVRRELEAIGGANADLDGLRDILGECRSGSIDSVCVDLGEIDYGTRSSTLLSYGGGAQPRFLHADGPPCDTEYEDLSELATDLLG